MRSAPLGLNGAPWAKSTSPSGAGASAVASANVAPATVGAAAVEVAAGDQLADQRPRAARAVHRLGDVAAAGRQAREHRRARGELRQLVLRELDAGLARDREQVEHAVGRAAARGDARHRVAQRAAVEEAARRARSVPASATARAPGARGRLGLLRAVLRRDQRVARARPARGTRAPRPSCSP